MPGREARETVETLGDTGARMATEALYGQNLSTTMSEVETEVLVDAD